jgi:hypothetical protein
MPRPRPATTAPLICENCGDEIVIVASFTPTGPLCADCGVVAAPPEPLAPTNENPEQGLTDAKVSPAPPPAEVAPGRCNFTGCARVKGHTSFHTTIEAVGKDQDARAAAEAAVDPRSFVPEPRAQELSIEVEEWIYQEYKVLLATPIELMVDRIQTPLSGARYSRFMVVLEWCRDGGPTLRDIGPGFGTGLTTRQEGLAQATAFARAEARRLKACGPFGYKPARPIRE